MDCSTQGFPIQYFWRRQWHPTPVLLPGKSHGRRSLVGCSPWGSLGVGHDWATSLSLFTVMHWRRKWQPTPVFLPGESQGWGSLVGCSLWGRTELDTTEATGRQQQQHTIFMKSDIDKLLLYCAILRVFFQYTWRMFKFMLGPGPSTPSFSFYTSEFSGASPTDKWTKSLLPPESPNRLYLYSSPHKHRSPGGSEGKAPARNAGAPGSIPG